MATYSKHLLSNSVNGKGILLTGTKATALLTSSGTNVTAADTITVNGKVYTFVVTPEAEGDVKIGDSASATLDNLKSAINFTGDVGTDHYCAARHPEVEATDKDATTLLLRSRSAGTGGNLYTLTTTAATYSVSGSTFGTGTGATAGVSKLIHTAIAGTTDFDEVTLFAYNNGTETETLTFEWGGVTAADQMILHIPAQSGDMYCVAGRLLQNGLTITAFASEESVVTVHGFVNRITA
jgi:hypothetical protein